MISDAIALYSLIRDIYRGRKLKIVAALFDWEATRLEGDERVNVQFNREEEAHPDIVHGTPDRWWYCVEPFDNYQFIRIPVNAGGVIEDLGRLRDDSNCSADYFRYVAVPDGRLRGSIPNVKVTFMIFGYRPSDLLETGKTHL